ncbi:MAG: primosomal protein N', partial [Myxococcales bacterium]|nr:primosomal protein N' [Myxococcales bacterium]
MSGSEAPLHTVEVAVPVPLRQAFHYRLRPGDVGRAVPGARVLVQFARRALVGYVVAVDTPAPPDVKLAAVRELLDPPDAPTFDGPLLRLLLWMADYYRAPVGEVLRAAHPAGINAKGVPGLALTAAGRAAHEPGATGQSLAWLARQGGE